MKKYTKTKNVSSKRKNGSQSWLKDLSGPADADENDGDNHGLGTESNLLEIPDELPPVIQWRTTAIEAAPCAARGCFFLKHDPQGESQIDCEGNAGLDPTVFGHSDPGHGIEKDGSQQVNRRDVDGDWLEVFVVPDDCVNTRVLCRDGLPFGFSLDSEDS